MFKRRMVAVLLCAALLFSSTTQAQPLPNTPPGAQAVKFVVKEFTGSQITSMVGGSPISRVVQWGAQRPYTLLIGSSLIYAGLSWFYDQAQQATGTPLDNWWHGSPSGAESMSVRQPTAHTSSNWNFRITARGNDTGAMGASRSYSKTTYPTEAGARQQARADAEYEWMTRYGAQGGSMTGWQQIPDSGITPADVRYFYEAQVPLLQHLQNNPSSAQAIADQVLPHYVDNNMPLRVYPFEQPWIDGTPTEWEWNNLDPDPNQNPDPGQDPDPWPDYEPRPDPTLEPDLSPIMDDFALEVTQRRNEELLRRILAEEYAGNTEMAGLPANQWNTLRDIERALKEGIQVEIPEFPEFPDNLATEATQGQVLAEISSQTAVLEQQLAEAQAHHAEAQQQTSLLEEIRDALQAPDSEVVLEWDVIEDPEFDLTPLEQWQPSTQTQAQFDHAYQAVLAEVATELDTVYTAAQGRFPFGLTEWAAGDLPTVSTANCPTINMALASTSGSINMCNNPLDSWMTTTGRAMMGALLTIGFILLAFNIVTRS